MNEAFKFQIYASLHSALISVSGYRRKDRISLLVQIKGQQPNAEKFLGQKKKKIKVGVIFRSHSLEQQLNPLHFHSNTQTNCRLTTRAYRSQATNTLPSFQSSFLRRADQNTPSPFGFSLIFFFFISFSFQRARRPPPFFKENNTVPYTSTIQTP